MGYKLMPIVAAGLSLTFYAAAFLGEIWRGCIEAVPRTQWEASDCLGLNRFQQYAYVILPQAVRIAIPPTVGFMVQIVKNTSLASVIGFVELARAGQIVNNSTFEPFVIFTVVAAIYFVHVLPAVGAGRALERRAACRPTDARDVKPSSSIENVVKEFGPLRVLDGVGFDVARGQIVAIVGRSGSGKSTLLRCIAGLETVQGGTITVCGHAVGRPGSAARAQLRRDVGMVFQSYNLFPHLTVERNITLALHPGEEAVARRGPDAGRRGARAWSGLTDKRAAYPEQLSGGQQQRVAIARSLALSAAGHAVRRGDLGARSRAHRRGAGGDGGSRAARHDHDQRHPRDGLRAPRRRPRGVHAQGQGVGDRPDRRAVRQAEDGRVQPVRRQRALAHWTDAHVNALNMTRRMRAVQ